MTAVVQSITGYANAVANLPAGTVAGDLLVIFANTYDGDAATITIDQAGWSTKRGPDRKTGSNSITNYVFWKIATASEPSSFSLTIGGSSTNYYDMAIARITNFDSAQPFQVDSYSTNGSSATRTGVSMTIDQDDTLVLCLTNGYNFSPSSTPAGLTQLVLYDGQVVYSAGAKNSGVYAFPDITQGGSDSFLNSFVGIRPVAGAAPKIKRQAVFF